MKKTICLILLLCVILAGHASAEELTPGSGYMNIGGAKDTREYPDLNAGLFSGITIDEPVIILTVQGDWLEIAHYSENTGWITGWITKDSIVKGAPDYELPSGIARVPASVYGHAMVYSASGQRVNLREGPSVDTKSLGLYYSGAPVLCDIATDTEWVFVIIGDQLGYMKSEYLYTGNDPNYVPIKTPIMVVSNASASGWLNMRSKPSLDAFALAKFDNGREVTVLGDVGDWYHVRMDYGATGYMVPQYLKPIGGGNATPKPGAATPKPGGSVPTASSPPNGKNGYSAYVSTHFKFADSGYTVSASVNETQSKVYDVEIRFKFDPGFMMNDVIVSYNLYINGDKVAIVSPPGKTGDNVPTVFRASVNYSGVINSIHLVPVSEKTGGEWVDWAIYPK